MNLSAEQARAVNSQAPHKRIIAPAGSGKTRLLVAQVGHWLEDSDMGTMAAITFTRRSGEELRRRITQEYGVALGYVGTVHGMAYLAMSLADDGKHRLTPLTGEECVAVVDHVAAECRLQSATCPKVYKAIQGEQVNVDTLKSTQRALLHAVKSYMAGCRMVHVGELVARFATRMDESRSLLAWVRSHARTIMWDEYQDTTVEESQVLDFAAPDRSLVVGDPMQAIFGFRLASDQYLWNRKAESHSITFNFRSCANIVAVANRARARGLDELVAFRREPGHVVGVPCTAEETISHVAHVATSTEFPVHVLCRTNREVAIIRDVLESRGIRVIAASPRFDRFSKPPWTGLFLAARHVLDPSCEWLQSAMKRANVQGTMLSDMDPRLETIGELLTRYSPTDAKSISHEAVLGLSILDFVAWYQRRDLEDLLPGEGEADVILMTAHASKGLEFNNVVLADVGRRLGGGDREEQNLLYVAITRARERLTLVGDPGTVDRLTQGGRCEHNRQDDI